MLGYVPHGYDAILNIIFVVVDFVCIGKYDQRCRHSCNVEWLKDGIACRSVDELLLNQRVELVSSEYHSWVFRDKGGVEDNAINLVDPFGALVDFFFSLEEDAVPAVEVKNTR